MIDNGAAGEVTVQLTGLQVNAVAGTLATTDCGQDGFTATGVVRPVGRPVAVVKGSDPLIFDEVDPSDSIPSPRPEGTTLDACFRAADYLPIKLRKEIRAMLGDYEADIAQLRAAGRSQRLLKWNGFLAGATFFWMLLARPVALLRDFIIARSDRA